MSILGFKRTCTKSTLPKKKKSHPIGLVDFVLPNFLPSRTWILQTKPNNNIGCSSWCFHFQGPHSWKRIKSGKQQVGWHAWQKKPKTFHFTVNTQFSVCWWDPTGNCKVNSLTSTTLLQVSSLLSPRNSFLHLHPLQLSYFDCFPLNCLSFFSPSSASSSSSFYPLLRCSFFSDFFPSDSRSLKSFLFRFSCCCCFWITNNLRNRYCIMSVEKKPFSCILSGTNQKYQSW